MNLKPTYLFKGFLKTSRQPTTNMSYMYLSVFAFEMVRERSVFTSTVGFFEPVLTFVQRPCVRYERVRRVVRSWELVSRFVGRRYHHQPVQGLTHNGDCCLSVRKGPEILRESYRHPAALNTGLFFVEDFYNTENSSVIQL